MRAKIEITSTLYNSAKRTGYHRNTVKISMLPSAAIRLRARDFYEVIVDEGEARINYHFIEIESE